MRTFPFVTILAALGAWAAPSLADDLSPGPAPRPPSAVHGELALGTSWAPAFSYDGYDPYGVAFRGRVGVEFRGIYAGYTVSQLGAATGNAKWIETGPQVGYGWRFAGDLFTLRPVLGAGLSVVVPQGNDGGAFSGAPLTRNGPLHVYLEPGVTFLVNPRPWMFVAANASLLLPAVDQGAPPGANVAGISFGGEIGVRFL